MVQAPPPNKTEKPPHKRPNIQKGPKHGRKYRCPVCEIEMRGCHESFGDSPLVQFKCTGCTSVLSYGEKVPRGNGSNKCFELLPDSMQYRDETEERDVTKGKFGHCVHIFGPRGTKVVTGTMSHYISLQHLLF